jgi:hypothetical protein
MGIWTGKIFLATPNQLETKGITFCGSYACTYVHGGIEKPPQNVKELPNALCTALMYFSAQVCMWVGRQKSNAVSVTGLSRRPVLPVS